VQVEADCCDVLLLADDETSVAADSTFIYIYYVIVLKVHICLDTALCSHSETNLFEMGVKESSSCEETLSLNVHKPAV